MPARAAVFHDQRFAMRGFRRNPAFTATAVLALALGIGANTAIFSVVNKVLLEPLPYPEPDRLVQLMTKSDVGDQSVVSIPKFVLWRSHLSLFTDIAAYQVGGPGITLTQDTFPEAVRAGRVSWQYFRLFGAAVETGRTFTAAEDMPGARRVVVLSDAFWRARFRADPRLIGRSISLDSEPYTVIGILDAGFRMDPPAELWLPLQTDSRSSDHVGRVRVAARIKPGVDFDSARQQVEHTVAYWPWREHLLYHERFTAIPLRDAIVGDVRRPLYLLLGAVACVLLISCANVANLLLARATRRAREIAIRAALGAGRRRIVRQLLAESLLLALAGGALGLGAGYLGVRALLAASPAEIPRVGANGAAIALDWRVFLFTLLVSAATGVLFGIVPALHASRADISTLVKDSSSQSGMGFRRNRGRAFLAIGEMALALVLLACAGLLIRTFVSLRTVNRGFDENNVLTVEMSLASPQFDRTVQVAQLVDQAERRLRTLPAVSTVAATCALPLEPSLSLPFTIHGRDQDLVGRYHGAATWRSVTPAYFEAFQIRLLRGRFFTAADNERTAGVVLINRAMARRYWPEEDANPLGYFVSIGHGTTAGLDDVPREVVGIVADVRDAGLNREPMMYVPLAQLPDGLNARNHRLLPLTWIVRTNAAAAPRAAIERELRESAAGIPLERVRTMHEVVAASAARTGFYTMLLAIFAAIALVLAGFGLYGLLAYSVQQRTPEIGIRMALGAAAEDVRAMVVWQGMRLALLGILLGIPIALAVTRVMVSLIFGLPPWDPVVFAAVAALLGAAGLLASYLPAVRATRVDPVHALRS